MTKSKTGRVFETAAWLWAAGIYIFYYWKVLHSSYVQKALERLMGS